MAITLNQFFQQAKPVGGGAQASQTLYLNGDDQLSTKSAFWRIRISARAQENANTIQAFVAALRDDPVYCSHVDSVAHMFSMKARNGEPLKTEDIVWAKDVIDRHISEARLRRNVYLGTCLVKIDALPEGKGTAFGQFCSAKRITLKNLEDPNCKVLLKDFIKSQLLPSEMRQVGVANGLTPKEAYYMEKVLDKADITGEALTAFMDIDMHIDMGPDMDNGMEPYMPIDRNAEMLSETIVDDIDYEDVLYRVKAKADQTVKLLLNIPSLDIQGLLSRPDVRNILHTLEKAVQNNCICPKDVGALYTALITERRPLETAEDQCTAITAFQLSKLNMEKVQNMLVDKGLPSNLAGAFMNRPDVQATALINLQTDVPAPTVPTIAQLETVMKETVEAFVNNRGDEIAKFVKMAQNPPVDLATQLSTETLPKYINALLDGNKPLSVLFFRGPVEVGLMNAMAQVATESFKAAGEGDANGLQKDVLKLLLASRDTKPDHTTVEKALAKFGHVASEMISAANLLSSGELQGPERIAFQQTCMDVYGLLQSHISALLELLPADELAKMHIKGETLQEQVFHVIETHLQKEIPLENLSNEFREFATSNGVPMELLSKEATESVAKTNQSEAKDASKALISSILDEFFIGDADATNLTESPKGFHDAFDLADKKLGLTGKGMTSKQVESSSMFVEAKNACSDWINAQSGPVQSDDLRKIVIEQIEKELGLIADVMTAVDNLPDEKQAGGFSALEKTAMKEFVMGSEIRDIDFIGQIGLAGRAAKVALTEMLQPPLNPMKFNLGLKALLNSTNALAAYVAVNHGLRGVAESFRCVVEMGLSLANASYASREALFNFIDGKSVRQLLFMYIDREAVKSLGDLSKKIPTMPAFTQSLHVSLATSIGKALELDPLDFFRSSEQYELPLWGMELVNDVFPGAYTKLEQMLTAQVPTLNYTLQDVVIQSGFSILASASADKKKALDSFIAGSAKALVEAHEKVNTETGFYRRRELTPAEIWKAVTGKNAPKGLQHEHLGDRLHDFMVNTYGRALQQAQPNLSHDEVHTATFKALGAGVPFATAMELLKPGAALKLEDMLEGSMDLPPLAPGNGPIERLEVDLPVKGGNSLMRSSPLNGGMFLVRLAKPIHGDANGAEPGIEDFIEKADGMSQTTAQKLRILQCFTLDPIRKLSALGSAFPGLSLEENGNVEVKAMAQIDDSVLVELRSTNDERLQVTQCFVIQPDGSHTCTAFRMERNRR